MLKRFLSFYKPHMFLFWIDTIAAVLFSGLNILFPAITRNLLNVSIPNRNMRAIVISFIVLLIIWSLRAFFSWVRIKWGHVLGARIEADMRDVVFRHLQKLSFNYYDNTKTGHIMSRITNDLNMIAEVAHHCPEDLIISILTIIGSFIFMYNFNSTLATITLIPIIPLIVWGAFFSRRMKLGFKLVRTKIADVNSSVENAMQGIREVKSYAREEYEITKFSKVNGLFLKAKEFMYNRMATFFVGMRFLVDIYYGIILAAGTYLILHNMLSITDLLVFFMYINFIIEPINRLVNFSDMFQQGFACFERFVEIMVIEPDIVDKSNAVELDNISGTIELKGVDFSYSDCDTLILSNINMKISKGKTVAIVGESGAGKTSLVSLIPRFYEPSKGVVSIDGVNVSDLKQKFLRENIGLVQQNVFLFDTTIGENILYGNHEASHDDLIEAAKKANIYDFIMSLPKGFDTMVGEHGVKLSGGQKQRVSIARVFLKNPKIIIFDEATSALDTESEVYIQEAMNELSFGRTTIVIAHRLSTVANADYTYVMKYGKVVEEGKHSDLINIHDGYYRSLYERSNLVI